MRLLPSTLALAIFWSAFFSGTAVAKAQEDNALTLDVSPLAQSAGGPRVDESQLSPRKPRDVHPRLRGAWLLLQAVPSPGLAWGERGFHGTMTWQLTPLLYSWGMDKRLSPWRLFIVEPLVRQSGSIELFVSPEYLGRGGAERNYGFRAGLRSYFPLTERGDGLSFSIGASAHWFLNEPGASFDAGIYTLFGALGLMVSVSPWLSDNLLQTTLRVRYF